MQGRQHPKETVAAYAKRLVQHILAQRTKSTAAQKYTLQPGHSAASVRAGLAVAMAQRFPSVNLLTKGSEAFKRVPCVGLPLAATASSGGLSGGVEADLLQRAARLSQQIFPHLPAFPLSPAQLNNRLHVNALQSVRAGVCVGGGGRGR